MSCFKRKLCKYNNMCSKDTRTLCDKFEMKEILPGLSAEESAEFKKMYECSHKNTMIIYSPRFNELNTKLARECLSI